ncbi:MAG: OmpW family outer membrane protein [Ginsengibacter sp.]
MKNNIITSCFMIVSIFLAQSSTAQKNPLTLELNYNYSMPISGFKSDLVSNNSPRGFRGSLMYPFSNKLAAGVQFGFQDYYQKYPRDIYHSGPNQDISAVISNSIQTTPLILKAKYYPLSNSYVKPYISAGAGGNLINFKQYFGEFGNTQTNIGFVAQAGVGIMIPFKKMSTSGIYLGGTYDYAPYAKNGYKDLSSVNLQAGISFEIR